MVNGLYHQWSILSVAVSYFRTFFFFFLISQIFLFEKNIADLRVFSKDESVKSCKIFYQNCDKV